MVKKKKEKKKKNKKKQGERVEKISQNVRIHRRCLQMSLLPFKNIQ